MSILTVSNSATTDILNWQVTNTTATATNSIYPQYAPSLSTCTGCGSLYMTGSTCPRCHPSVGQFGSIGGLSIGGLTGAAYTTTFTYVSPPITVFLRYHPRAKCPKCRHAKSPKIKYCNGLTSESKDATCSAECGGKEHLHLLCLRCDYTWKMLAADQEIEGDENAESDL